MATKRQPKHVSVIDDATLNDLALSLARTVREEGSINFPAIVRAGVPKTQLDDAVAKLEEAGLEVTKKKVVRIPISEQIGALLAEGAVRKAKDIAAGVSGATKKDVDVAIAALVKQGKAQWVVRTKELLLMGESDDLLTAAELDTIERTSTWLTAAMKLARKKRATLLRSDVENVLPRFSTKAPVAETREAPEPETGDLPELVDRHRETTGLTFVPTLVRALGGKRARDEVHAALLKGARSGIFELRPESGLARLTPEDLSFCIPGPQGSKLSWVRRLDS